VILKRCKKCGGIKPIGSFVKDRRAKNGRRNKCCECYNEGKRTYRANNIEKVLKREAAWRIKNKDKENQKHKKWRVENKEKVKLKLLKWRRNNPEYMKNWLKKPKRKLGNSISSAMYFSLKNNKSGRHWENLVGYTARDLMKHLERQFVDGMSWENYGKWHVDHKIPISAFNYTKPEHSDFKRCWGLKNLQPLWAKENISKGAKLSKPFQPTLLMESH